jgi:hypothetical protein
VYALNDPYGNIIFRFVGEEIYDRDGAVFGYIRNGVVCDKDDSPTRAVIDGTSVEFPQGSTALVVEGNNVLDTSGVVEAVVVGTSNPAERMLAAAAYWEFFWSRT